MSETRDPMIAAAELIGEWTEVTVAAEAQVLATLRAEMTGLAELFGGTSTEKSAARLRAEQDATEAGFDNMPI